MFPAFHRQSVSVLRKLHVCSWVYFDLIVRNFYPDLFISFEFWGCSHMSAKNGGSPLNFPTPFSVKAYSATYKLIMLKIIDTK